MNTPHHVLKPVGGLRLCGVLALGSWATICVQLYLIEVLHPLTCLGWKGACR